MNLFKTALLAGALTLSANAATLIHYYPFDGSAVTDTVGSENGTLLGGASVSGGRLILDGSDDYVQFATALMPTSGDFSVYFEADMRAFPPGLYTEMISQGNTLYIGSDISNPPLVRVGDGWGNAGVFPSPGPHSYALTVDNAGNSSILYVDGLPFASNAARHGTSEATRLSRQYDGHSEYFPGSMDNVRIYTGVLTPQEVLDLDGLSSVPEPLSMSLIGAGLLAVGLYRRRYSR